MSVGSYAQSRIECFAAFTASTIASRDSGRLGLRWEEDAHRRVPHADLVRPAFLKFLRGRQQGVRIEQPLACEIEFCEFAI